MAQHGATLRYRVGSGRWLHPRLNAALYPAAATDIRVTKGGTSMVVHLG